MTKTDNKAPDVVQEEKSGKTSGPVIDGETVKAWLMKEVQFKLARYWLVLAALLALILVLE